MDDSYLKEFETIVKGVSNEKFIILEKTAFFPKGGGVEWDTGLMIRKSDNKEFKVKFTGKFDGNISHEVDQVGLQIGDEVKCFLDWDRRYTLMRYHTAAHVLSGVFNREYDLIMTGNQLTPEKGRIDMNMPEMNVDLIKEGFAKANDLIEKDLLVEIYYKSMEEAKKDSTLFKLAIGFPHDIKGSALYGYITIKDISESRNHDNLRTEINQLITDRIGPIAKLDKIQFTNGLPKTRSGKIMRRILRKIACNESDSLGDTSTLLNQEVVQEIIDNVL